MDNQKRKLNLPGISYYPKNLSPEETAKRYCAATEQSEADDTPQTVHLTERLQRIANQIFQYIRLPIDAPETLLATGINRTKGVLLFGGAGTGKTSIAKAVQMECNRTAETISFFSVEGSRLMRGDAAANITELFISARTFAPSVIFFDEVDLIFLQRGPESTAVLTLLTELEGCFASPGLVFVLAATNKKATVEKALLRPDRLEEAIELRRPSQAERLELLKIFTEKVDVTQISLANVAASTDDFTPADLRFLMKKAKMSALERDNKTLSGHPKDWKLPFVSLGNKVKLSQLDVDYALYIVKPTPSI